MGTTDHIARLYSVPPTQFMATRNRIASELRTAGRRAEARAVARLRKPSAALWAVNRLAGTDRNGLTSFTGAVDTLRRAQLRDPRGTADARQAQRAALEALVDRAKDLLTRSGLSASPPILRRISDTLMGAAINRARLDALRRGELSEELAAPGFEAFGGAGVPLRLVSRREAPRGAHDEPAARRAKADEADRHRRAVEAEALRRQAAEHQRSLTRLEAERAETHVKLEELQKQLRAARQATAAAMRARRKASR